MINSVKALFLLALCANLAAQSAQPGWHYPEAPVRFTCRLPKDPQPVHLLELPSEIFAGIGDLGFIARCDDPRAVRLVATNANAYTLLVDTSGAKAGSRMELYALTNGSAAAVSQEVADPLPVAVAVHKAGAYEAPPTWEEMRFMAIPPWRGTVRFLLEGIVPFKSEVGNAAKWHQPSWKRPSYVATMSTRLVIPEAGEYRLGVKGYQPHYLLINDKLVLQRREFGGPGSDWNTSEKLFLEKGIQNFTLHTLCEDSVNLEAGWITPGSESIVAIPTANFLTGRVPRSYRVEHRDTTLHAGIHHSRGRAYSFYGSDSVFTPVTMRALLSDRSGGGNGETNIAWYSDGALIGEGASHRMVATGAALPLELVVTNDSEVARVSTTVRLNEVSPREYRLSSQLIGVPAYGFDDDHAQPEIHVRGTMPDRIAITVAATVVGHDGVENTQLEVLNLKRGWVRSFLPARALRDLSAIKWRIIHAGEVIEEKEVTFLRPPFNSLPATTDGSFLTIDKPSVLVLPRSSDGHPTRARKRAAVRNIAMLDGFVVRNGTEADDRGQVFDRYIEKALGLDKSDRKRSEFDGFQRFGTHALSATATPRTLETLDLLTRLGELKKSGILLLAPEFRDWREAETIEQFERRLTALAALLQGAVAEEIILLTPPPGLLGDGTGASLSTLEYTRVISRVADTLGLKTIDLFTLAKTRAERGLVVEKTITDTGLRWIAEAIAESLR